MLRKLNVFYYFGKKFAREQQFYTVIFLRKKKKGFRDTSSRMCVCVYSAP